MTSFNTCYHGHYIFTINILSYLEQILLCLYNFFSFSYLQTQSDESFIHGRPNKVADMNATITTSFFTILCVLSRRRTTRYAMRISLLHPDLPDEVSGFYSRECCPAVR